MGETHRPGDRDEDHGLTPREWLESDPVPLTPDVDLGDPEQRIAWIRANNEEIYQRGLELVQRRGGGASGAGTASGAAAASEGGAATGRPGPRSTTTVVAVRVLNAERRALVRLARREEVTVSDLVRRWVRAGLVAGDAVDPEVEEPDEREATRQASRQAVQDAAAAAVERITDELRRLRELVAAAG